MQQTKPHEGRNVKRIREILGIKQDALARDLGISQQGLSSIEQKEALDEEQLKKIADALKVPVEAIQNFDEEKTVNIVSNTFNRTEFKGNSSVMNIKPVFDPVEKIVQLHEEKIALYERMLKEKDEMMAKLEKLIENK